MSSDTLAIATLVVGFILGYFFTRYVASTGVDSLIAELNKKVAEARDRENRSEGRAADKEAQMKAIEARVAALEVEKSQAVKDAEAANQRATEMIAKEQEKQAEVAKAKDEQIAKLNVFIEQAREVLKTEFKALSADALKDVSEQLIKTADNLIEKHGEKSAADVKLHHQQIETMLKPVEETIKRLDKHVEESDPPLWRGSLRNRLGDLLESTPSIAYAASARTAPSLNATCLPPSSTRLGSRRP